MKHIYTYNTSSEAVPPRRPRTAETLVNAAIVVGVGALVTGVVLGFYLLLRRFAL